MDDWATMTSPAVLLQWMTPISPNELNIEPQYIKLLGKTLPPVNDRRIAELFEAIFLESRQATVMFDVPEAEVIALRLLSALWPALRSNFSICTFALSPRTLHESKLFDLLFAPKAARPRFTDWAGRRIEGGTSSGTSRHRWTDATAQRVFCSPEPSLTGLDSLGAMKSDRKGDETALRLVLLWNELLEKSKTSPSAVLGLLDILSSQGMTFRDASDELLPLTEASVQLAVAHFRPSEAWTFLIALLGKFSPQLPPKALIRKIRDGAVALTQADFTATVHFFAAQRDEARPVPALIATGLGNGLASQDIPVLRDVAEKLSRQTLCLLLAYSPAFAASVARSVDVMASSEWIQSIVNTLSIRDASVRCRARRNFLPRLDNAAQAPLLEPLLAEMSPLALAAAVSLIWEKTKFSVEAFDEPFWRAARGEERLQALREAILSTKETDESNRFLASTLRLDETDVNWVCLERGLNSERMTELLARLLENSDEHSIQAITRRTDITRLLVDKLRQNSSRAATQIGRLLVTGQLNVEELLRAGNEILPYVAETIRSDLVHTMLFRGFAEGGPSITPRLVDVIAVLADHVDTYQIVLAATSPEINSNQIGENVALLGQTKGQLRHEIISHIGVLTDRLVNRRGNYLSAQAIEVWACLLAESGDVNQQAQIGAAATVLSYALRNVNGPHSPLVVAAFPVIYKQLRAEQDPPPGLFASFFFQDWDRCRTARKDIVDAYMRSSWPPADLLLAASRAGDGPRVLKRVSREYRGSQYIKAIADDLYRFPDSVRWALIQQLEIFNSDPSPFLDK
ncbi:hypothetical protein KSF73_09820 [Burkholderiaceae bacterium DAT-1]|nr:hypothetical protein [Burkholderiaceae bacterium DAT-1]